MSTILTFIPSLFDTGLKSLIEFSPNIFFNLLSDFHFPKYFEAKQKNRDATRKCKSYRALAEIAYGLYKEDPDGTEWQEKFEEAQKRQAQYKCTSVISISQ